MDEFNQLLDEYDITPSDIHAIKEFSLFMEGEKEKILDCHCNKLVDGKDTAQFCKDEKVVKKLREAISTWFSDFLSADYSSLYADKLTLLGHTFVKLGLPESIINATISSIRGHLIKRAFSIYGSQPEKAAITVTALNKALDINLDYIMRSSHEEELRTQFLSHKIDYGIIRISKWFVSAFNVIMAFGLIGIGLFALVLCAVEMFQTITSEIGMEHGVLSALGTLLVLWVVIELLDTQVRHIKGHSFAIKVFVTVALVAELRKILVISVEHASWEKHAAIALTVLVLGVIYWMISKVEKAQN